MPHYGRTSLARLDTCHDELQAVFLDVINHFDCKILYGRRTDEEQIALYAQGRTTPGGIVTNVDGIIKKSDHQADPSNAVDAIPYPVNWGDISRMYFFAGHVMQIARALGVDMQWGGDWDSDTEVDDQTFMDLPHFARRTV